MRGRGAAIEVATLGRPATVDAIDQALAEHGDSLVVETLDTDAMVDVVAGAFGQIVAAEGARYARARSATAPSSRTRPSRA